jgi:hypothetical protein
MGEKPNQPFQISFNASLKVDYTAARGARQAGKNEPSEPR